MTRALAVPTTKSGHVNGAESPNFLRAPGWCANESEVIGPASKSSNHATTRKLKS